MSNATYNHFRDGFDLYNYSVARFKPSNYELKDTIEGMNSDNHIEREFAEYQQLAIRLYKLREFIRKYENLELTFKPACSLDTLKTQESAMNLYKHILEERFLDECREEG